MQASVAEEGSPVGMLNVAFMLQRGLGYSAFDRHTLAYDLLLRAACLERYYGDGLVDAAAIMYDGERYVYHALSLHVTPRPFHTEVPYYCLLAYSCCQHGKPDGLNVLHLPLLQCAHLLLLNPTGDNWTGNGSEYSRCALCGRLGLSGGRNFSRALELYEQAAGRNDTEGMTGLAWMHEHGEGTRSGHANTTLALQLYWQAVEGAPGASYAAAPFLLYLWLRLRLIPASIAGLKSEGDIVADLVNVVTLTLSLLFVVWLRRSRVWLGLRQHR